MNVLFGVEQTSEGTVFPLGRIHTRVPEKNRNSDDDERGTPMAEDRPPSFIIISFSFSSSFHWFCSLFFSSTKKKKLATEPEELCVLFSNPFWPSACGPLPRDVY